MPAKPIAEMTTSELLAADRETGNLLDAVGKAREPILVDPRPRLLSRRREIRARLNELHEAESDSVTCTDCRKTGLVQSPDDCDPHSVPANAFAVAGGKAYWGTCYYDRFVREPQFVED
jgi:hypothetical protein